MPKPDVLGGKPSPQEGEGQPIVGTEGELTLSSISEPGKQCVFAAALNLKERGDSHVLEW